MINLKYPCGKALAVSALTGLYAVCAPGAPPDAGPHHGGAAATTAVYPLPASLASPLASGGPEPPHPPEGADPVFYSSASYGGTAPTTAHVPLWRGGSQSPD
jgi:hypothetical protein